MIPDNKITPIVNTLIPHLYSYQEEILKNNGKQIIINKSRQIGISYLISALALVRAIFQEKTELIISPSLRQSKHMMDYIYQHLNKLREDFNIPLREETKTSLIFLDGGEIHSLPNSANTVRGYPADDIYIDEFAHFTCGTDKEVIDAITPSLSRGGRLYMISTPFGDQNLFYEYWHNREDITRVKINWRDCPDISEEKINEIRGIIGEDAFLQEYENQFLSDIEGQEFPTELIEQCINHDITIPGDPAQAFQQGETYIGGLDIGRRHDLTALVTLQKQDDKYVVNFIHTMKNTPYNEQTNYIRYILNNAFFSSFTVDETGIGNEMAENLRNEYNIRTISFTNENKQEMVMNLKKMMQQNKIQIPYHVQLINSIRSIRRVYTPSNYLRFESPRDSEIGHADLFWSLCLAVYGLSKQHARRGFRL